MGSQVQCQTTGGLDPHVVGRCRREIHRLLRLPGSTTFFLEDLAHREIRVRVVTQQGPGPEDGVIRRESVLHLDDVEAPVLFSVCALESRRLTRGEQTAVLDGGTPLGKIFDPENRGRLGKSPGVIREEENPLAAQRLGTGTPWFYSRSYELLLEDQPVGKITESLNEESLARLWKVQA